MLNVLSSSCRIETGFSSMIRKGGRRNNQHLRGIISKTPFHNVWRIRICNKPFSSIADGRGATHLMNHAPRTRGQWRKATLTHVVLVVRPNAKVLSFFSLMPDAASTTVRGGTRMRGGLMTVNLGCESVFRVSMKRTKLDKVASLPLILGISNHRHSYIAFRINPENKFGHPT